MLRSYASTTIYLLIEDVETIGLQRCNKILSFNQKFRSIGVIFSDEIVFTLDAVVFVKMTNTWQRY